MSDAALERRDRLYTLLPRVHRLRDAGVGWPLRALLRVIAEQVDIVEKDIERLYANWFIETCEDWVVPYVGDLIGYQPVHEAGLPSGVTAREERALSAILSPRRDVANTVRDRRRKGTLALLQKLADDVAGWPAWAVESYALLAVTQSVNHVHLHRGRTVDLRDGDALDRLEDAFDTLAHMVDVRRINSTRTCARHSIPGVGLFVWRLKSYSITRSPAHCIDRARNHFTFNILGNDTQLITRPVVDPQQLHRAGEMDIPAWIRRRALDERTADYYGRNKSIRIWRDRLDNPVPLDEIVAADLSEWTYRPQRDQVAVDPVLGRIAFPLRNAPKTGVWVTYHYGFSDDMGGGEYWRDLRPVGTRPLYRVGPGGDFDLIMDAVNSWQNDKVDPAKKDAIIEITDSGAYQEKIEISLEADDRLELRAAQGVCPVIRLFDWSANQPDNLRIRGVPPQPPTPAGAGEQEGEGSPDTSAVAPGGEGPSAPPLETVPPCHLPPRLVLDGLLITGRGLEVVGSVRRVTIRHCTLVPGWSLEHDCQPKEEGEPSVELDDATAALEVEGSIIGGIRVNESEVSTEPISITLSDSIVDATGPVYDAVSAPERRHAYAVLSIQRTTVLGQIRVHAMELAENSIFSDQVWVARRHVGCVRFCYVVPGSRTPRRYECQPDLVVAATLTQLPPRDPRRDAARRLEEARVRPQFMSVRYGTPTYCQLAQSCVGEIRQGADDEAEMGAFHNLFQPQREANLLTRLEEYTPAGTDAAIILVT